MSWSPVEHNDAAELRSNAFRVIGKTLAEASVTLVDLLTCPT